MPVLVGRVFLFGPDMAVPYLGDGSLIVDLYDSSPHHGPDTEPKLIDELRIDPESLKKFAKKDMIGEGYTIIFPWYSYRMDISHVYIIMRYEFPDKTAIVHQSGTVTINHVEAQERVRKGMPISNPAMRTTTGPSQEVLPQPSNVAPLPQPSNAAPLPQPSNVAPLPQPSSILPLPQPSSVLPPRLPLIGSERELLQIETTKTRRPPAMPTVFLLFVSLDATC